MIFLDSEGVDPNLFGSGQDCTRLHSLFRTWSKQPWSLTVYLRSNRYIIPLLEMPRCQYLWGPGSESSRVSIYLIIQNISTESLNAVILHWVYFVIFTKTTAVDLMTNDRQKLIFWRLGMPTLKTLFFFVKPLSTWKMIFTALLSQLSHEFFHMNMIDFTKYAMYYRISPFTQRFKDNPNGVIDTRMDMVKLYLHKHIHIHTLHMNIHSIYVWLCKCKMQV